MKLRVVVSKTVQGYKFESFSIEAEVTDDVGDVAAEFRRIEGILEKEVDAVMKRRLDGRG